MINLGSTQSQSTQQVYTQKSQPLSSDHILVVGYKTTSESMQANNYLTLHYFVIGITITLAKWAHFIAISIRKQSSIIWLYVYTTPSFRAIHRFVAKYQISACMPI